MDDASSEAMKFLRDRGYDVTVTYRNLHAELLASGQPGRASFFEPGAGYACVSLEREGEVVWPDIAHAATMEAAVIEAARRLRR